VKRSWFILALLVASAVRAATGAPNFVFILVDDQSWSGTSVAMIPGKDFSRTPSFRMPNLDRLAAEGMVFRRPTPRTRSANARGPRFRWGGPPRASTPSTSAHGNGRRRRRIHSVNALKRANSSYRAAHVGKWQWPTAPAAFGYDLSDGITQNEDGDTTNPDDPKQSFSITRRAEAFMAQQVKDGHPFYLQLSYYAVHQRPQALAATIRRYGGGGSAVFAAMTEDLDTCLGVLRQKIGALGIADNTYVIYMSDNGGRSDALKGGKALCDEGGIRVPLVVQGPGVAQGSYCNTPVISYDIYPTLLDLVAPNAALPAGIEGGSWQPLLKAGGVGEVARPIDRLVWHHDVEIDHPQTAMRQGDLKLVHYWDTKQDFLYDLAADLGERQNLAAQKPEQAARMLAVLKAHVRAGLGETKFALLESGKFESTDSRGEKGKGKGKGKGTPRE
jgi:arylsulfatase A-like enzyme